ncbi:plasmid mobilization relaxosome protein MobC [Saccharothrix saharensis]|uniref:plasmid mobilization relaxosome protein MobC n=1 Tax=Saccharothrix saharensis TaxID=571190 RepID=UPI001152415E
MATPARSPAPARIGHGGHLAPIPGGRRRQLLLRFTAAELAEVTGRAAVYGVAPAAFAHITARFFEPTARALRRLRPPMSRQDAVALAADLVPLRRTLSGIGANLNQLARAANASDQGQRGAAHGRGRVPGTRALTDRGPAGPARP